MYPCLVKFCWLNFLDDFLPRGETAYIETLTRLRARMWRVKPNLPIDYVLLLHDNAWLYTSLRTRETIASFMRITLPHPTYSPDLVTSDYHLFSSMKEGSRGKHYAIDKEVKTAVIKWLKEQSKEGWDTCSHAKVEHCYWEKLWLCWEVRMRSTEDQLHFDVW